jgi:hypothetical protein
VTPSGTNPGGAFGIVSAYDPNSGKVFVHDLTALYTYDPASNAYQKLAGTGGGVNYHCCGVIDPKRKKMVIIGSGDQWVFDIGGTTYTRQSLNSTGGSTLVNSGYPGLAYDPVRDRIVGWNGGDAVYSLDMDTRQWTVTSSYTGGPGTANGSGTYKRFSYIPALDLYVVNNTYRQNTFTFRFPGSAAEKKFGSAASSEISISPNPAKDRTRIRSRAKTGISQAAVYNLRGQLIQTLDPDAMNNAGCMLDTKALPGGVYLLKAKTGNGLLNKTLFINR